MTNGLAGATGLIGTAVGLGVTVGALGLGLQFVDRAFDRATPRNGGRRRRASPRRRSSSIFDIPQTSRRRRQDNIFGGNLF